MEYFDTKSALLWLACPSSTLAPMDVPDATTARTAYAILRVFYPTSDTGLRPGQQTQTSFLWGRFSRCPSPFIIHASSLRGLRPLRLRPRRWLATAVHTKESLPLAQKTVISPPPEMYPATGEFSIEKYATKCKMTTIRAARQSRETYRKARIGKDRTQNTGNRMQGCLKRVSDRMTGSPEIFWQLYLSRLYPVTPSDFDLLTSYVLCRFPTSDANRSSRRSRLMST
jgi:hypothetical protein